MASTFCVLRKVLPALENASKAAVAGPSFQKGPAYACRQSRNPRAGRRLRAAREVLNVGPHGGRARHPPEIRFCCWTRWIGIGRVGFPASDAIPPRIQA